MFTNFFELTYWIKFGRGKIFRIKLDFASNFKIWN